jgi:hypothetical protein
MVSVNNYYLFIPLFILIIAIGIVLGLSVVNIIDRRLSNISIRIPDQHIYLKMDNKDNIKLNVEKSVKGSTITLPITNISNIPSSYISKKEHNDYSVNGIESFEGGTEHLVNGAGPHMGIGDISSLSPNTPISIGTNSETEEESIYNHTIPDTSNISMSLSTQMLSDLNKNIQLTDGQTTEINSINLTKIINSAVKNALNSTNTQQNNDDVKLIENFAPMNTGQIQKSNYYANLYANHDPQHPFVTNNSNMELQGYNVSNYDF